VLSIGTHLIPHPRKAASGGEDAFFTNSDAGGVFAIADGVSGYFIFETVSPPKRSAAVSCNQCLYLLLHLSVRRTFNKYMLLSLICINTWLLSC